MELQQIVTNIHNLNFKIRCLFGKFNIQCDKKKLRSMGFLYIKIIKPYV